MNFWSTKWKWQDGNDETLVSGTENTFSTKGTVKVGNQIGDIDSAVLMLAGLYIKNYISEMAVTVTAIVIPIVVAG